MKITAALLLATGTCGAGFLAGWLVFRHGETCKVQLPPTQPARIDLPTEAVALLDALGDQGGDRLVKQARALMVEVAMTAKSQSADPTPR